MLKWPACCQWYCILCFSYCFTNLFRSPSMTTMSRLLKHSLRLHFFKCWYYQQNIAPRTSQHWENSICECHKTSFYFFKMLAKISEGDCGCCIALKLQLKRRKMFVEVFRRHITLAFDKHEKTLRQTYSDYKSIQTPCCDENDKTK